MPHFRKNGLHFFVVCNLGNRFAEVGFMMEYRGGSQNLYCNDTARRNWLREYLFKKTNKSAKSTGMLQNQNPSITGSISSRMPKRPSTAAIIWPASANISAALAPPRPS
jgi:hypothetical protein